MKLKLVKFRKSGMKSLVLLNPKGGSFKWSSIGDIVEVDDDLAYKLLSDCGDMLEIIRERKPRKPKEEPIEE